jgi:flagellar biosynthesis regulator FlaF
MFKSSYAETLAHDPKLIRASEREALEELALRLRKVESMVPQSKAVYEVIALFNAVWSALLADLASHGNDLPVPVRAKLISIGFSVLRESEKIRLGQSTNIAYLRQVTETIASGLL